MPLRSEENAYRLIQTLVVRGVDVNRLYAAFVSNKGSAVALWRQRSSSLAGGLVVWDYHVRELCSTK